MYKPVREYFSFVYNDFRYFYSLKKCAVTQYMAMLTDRLLNYLVKRKMAQKEPSALLKISQAKTIVLLVQLHDKQLYNQLRHTEFINQFHKKDVWIIGLNQHKKGVHLGEFPENIRFIELQSRDFNLLGWPKGKLQKKIPTVKPDLIINFDHAADPRLTYIAGLMPTGFRLGLGQANSKSYHDLMLSIDETSSLKEIFEHFSKYLDSLYGHDKT